MIDRVIPFFGFVVPAFAQQLALAAFFGLFLGSERALRGKVASLRTFAMICAGSCLFTVLSINVAGHSNGGPYDVTRLAAAVVTGIGFVGGGVIFKSERRIQGISTAAMIWMAAGIGMACGFNRIQLAVWSFSIYLLIVVTSVWLHRFLVSGRAHSNEEEPSAQR